MRAVLRLITVCMGDFPRGTIGDRSLVEKLRATVKEVEEDDAQAQSNLGFRHASGPGATSLCSCLSPEMLAGLRFLAFTILMLRRFIELIIQAA